MFCPACGAPVGKHQVECHQCEADLTRIPKHTESYAARNRALRLLTAKNQAALLKIAPIGPDELPEAFIQRVTAAQTKALDDLDRQMTIRGIPRQVA